MKDFSRLALLMVALAGVSFALDSGIYRLLSVTQSGKLILISQQSNKARYLLDASNAKITMDGKPIEFKDLRDYVRLQVKFDLSKSAKDGIEIDGIARDILVISKPEDK